MFHVKHASHINVQKRYVMNLDAITKMVEECLASQKAARNATQPVLIECMNFALANTNDAGLGDLRPINQLVSGIQALRHMNIDGLISWVLIAAGATYIPATNSKPAEIDTTKCVLKWKQGKDGKASGFEFRKFKVDGKFEKRPLSAVTAKSMYTTNWWELNPKEQTPYKPVVLADLIAAVIKKAEKKVDSDKDKVDPALLADLNKFAEDHGIVVQ